jgi:hypothetical protein
MEKQDRKNILTQIKKLNPNYKYNVSRHLAEQRRKERLKRKGLL